MTVEKCPKNVRCDTANCHTFATYNINTNGYKKNICLCDNCFNQLYLSMQKAKRNNSKKLKGDN